MNINTSIRNTSIQPKPQAAAPSTQQAEDPLDQMDQAYERYNELRQDSEKFTPYRMGASILLGVAAAGAAGYFMGGATGIAGRVAGSLVGAAAGVTTGALAGSVAAEMSNAGSGALGYLGLGIMGGGAAGLAAGAFLVFWMNGSMEQAVSTGEFTCRATGAFMPWSVVRRE